MLDRHLENSPKILEKVQNETYAQNLYAALCNMQWKTDNISVGVFAVTWRTAGGIVADLRGRGEKYLDWYCTGLAPKRQDEVSEGTVTDEIQNDLKELGWEPVPYDEF